MKGFLKRMYNKVTDFIIWGGNRADKALNPMVGRLFKTFSNFNMRGWILLGLIVAFVLGGFVMLWVSTFELPNLNNFEERRIVQSTKIYDRTGDVVLFDVHGEITRTVVPLDEMSDHIKWATIAIEDSNFYNHNGIEPKAIARAIYVNLKTGDLLGGQGGSTITQQVIKNALLTTDKKVSRKLKEWVLAPRLEAIMTKDEILETYLNEVPYGGTVYGIQEASRRFFSKNAADLTIAQSAYLAALPQAPTFYSPYGNNLEQLERRKNLVLDQMLSNQFITKEEHGAAKEEGVEFEKPENFGIKSPHFVFYIREQLEEEYGVEAVEQGGLKVITTLDWELQEKAEELVNKWALENEERFGAENGSIVSVDPKTGQILVMVGSRDYFDEDIDGNFNIATAERQPGSSFKPFVYAEAFQKGYRPETVVFDLSTEFSTACQHGGECYHPTNYDGTHRGPISLREALAQSVNVPAVKVLYLAGLRDSLSLAKKMGVETLTNIDQYGLTLVLGGGEVRPLDMASAYGVFGSGGVRHETTGILKIEDKNGNVLEEYEEKGHRVLDSEIANTISSILSDNAARAPVFGSNSYLNIPQVAVKTGTTNNFRDAWVMSYNSDIATAVWVGNNDNRPMNKLPAASIAAPMWAEYIRTALETYPGSSFGGGLSAGDDVKPIIRGVWDNQESGVHNILHFVSKSNPLGGGPRNPSADPQYSMWEQSVRAWAQGQGFSTEGGGTSTDQGNPGMEIINPVNGVAYPPNYLVVLKLGLTGGVKVSSSEVLLNGAKIGEINKGSNSFSFQPQDHSFNDDNDLVVKIVDQHGDSYEDSVDFSVSEGAGDTEG